MNLSARCLTFVALVCLLGIADLWRGDEHWWRYVAALLVFAIALDWLLTRAIGLAVEVAGNTQLRLGRPEQITLSLSHDRERNLRVRFVPALPQALAADERVRQTTLVRGEVTSYQLDVTSQALGEFSWEQLPLHVLGPLGLAWWGRRLPSSAVFTVVPDLAGARGAAQGDIHQGERAVRTGGGMELDHLREYVPGDPLRSVNWKASARSQRLMTRVTREDQHLDVLLVLDIGRTSRTHVQTLSQFGHYANLAAKFAEFAVANGDRVGLIAIADEPQAVVPPQGGVRGVRALRGALMPLAPLAVETNLVAAAVRAQRLVTQRSLIIVLTDFYGQDLAGSFGRSLMLWHPRHLPMVVGLLGNDVLDLLDQDAQHQVDPYYALAAQDYMQVLEANAAAARRLGAHAIVSRPEVLQSRVMGAYQLLRRQHRV